MFRSKRAACIGLLTVLLIALHPMAVMARTAESHGKVRARATVCYCPSHSYLCYLPGIGGLYWVPQGCHG